MARATLIGFSAVLMWSILALLTDMSGNVAPFLLAALSFAIGAIVGLIAQCFQRNKNTPKQPIKIPIAAWVLGVIGLFGYHFFYFTALRHAPAVDASIIAYLWPLFIVVGSSLMPGEKLRWNHVLGTILGLAGAVLIVTKGQGFSFDNRYAFGYACAFIGAFIWSGYSLLSRRFAQVPTGAVSGFCGAASVLSFGCHLIFEEALWPVSIGQWMAVVGLGLMPLGAAFYAWDIGVKHGNIQVLGAASYGAPLFSTLILISVGRADAHWTILVACGLITSGAIIAAWRMLFGAKE